MNERLQPGTLSPSSARVVTPSWALAFPGVPTGRFFQTISLARAQFATRTSLNAHSERSPGI
jgi:hypothetical protein